MDLPSFIWLWKIAAWAMGFSLLAYLLLALSGGWLVVKRQHSAQPNLTQPQWVISLHNIVGVVMVVLVLVLLAIGIVGTLGHYGSLGHSWHLAAGLYVVSLVFLSAWSAVQITLGQPWARLVHNAANAALLVALGWVSLTGWDVVQKYLP